MPNCNCYVTAPRSAASISPQMAAVINNKKKSIFNGWVREGITFSVKREEKVKEVSKRNIKFI